MVLQRGALTSVWGTSTKIGDLVELLLDGAVVARRIVDSTHVWQIFFKPPSNPGPHVLTASSSLGNVSISDVLFGDVWVCSGQSNMEFMTLGLQNATEEYIDAANYPNIRLFKVDHAVSATPLQELTKVGQVWNKASKAAVNAFTPSALFNAMINPLLRNTIYGAIWYQGESNSGRAAAYACEFPAMIDDWRAKFHQYSLTTNANFPFGFVQLAPWRPNPKSRAFSDLRWSQTAEVGFVPNSKMNNTFMAVAIDLPDYTSPYGSIHPRYKHDIARRLGLSSLAVAYHQTGFDYQGPFPTSYKLDRVHSHVVIEFDHGNTPIEVRETTGFEICCTYVNHICEEYAGGWKNATMTSHSTTSVTLDAHNCNVGGVRYAWRESPCELRKCAVYSRDSNLPAPPFKHEAFLQ
ncbi:hypothetical protein FSP39_022378 [Pinctada imbricata]|uniref:Sialate O-acetylesterase domain-containing protein n=1 Tax=Pinctada imbricata TaxID=66713 RepID=A0AA88YGA6_PINIB|nr:hypothetical protein FSP39_022378 [Pinctada imbricata]